MKIQLLFRASQYTVDLSSPIDISIPLISGVKGPKCFHAPDFMVQPVTAGGFIGSTTEGSPVNFKNIFVNPHGNGTHTECVGHITKEPYTINQCLREFHFVGRLITTAPDFLNKGDSIITEENVSKLLNDKAQTDVIIIRTLPNGNDKIRMDYSDTNPPYFSEAAIKFLNDFGMVHLITDLPSLDREKDGGMLSCHKAFWGLPNDVFTHKTITEMVYINDEIEDGLYFCNIQIASIESDASPSKIVLYQMEIKD